MAPRFGGAPKCPTCNKSVYAAEEMKVAGLSYHSDGCFRCISCEKTLQISSASFKDTTPYCQGCFAAEHGPEGFRGAGKSAGLRRAFIEKSSGEASAKPGSAFQNKQPKFCGSCGEKRTADAKFCGNCGTKY